MAITNAQQVQQMQLVKKREDGKRPGYYGADEAHENDPGHGSNAPGGNNDNKGSDKGHSRFDEKSGYYGTPKGSTFETYRGGKNIGVDNKLASKFGNQEQKDRANKALAKGNLYSTGPNQSFFERANTYNTNFQRNQMLNLAKKRSFQKYQDIEQYVDPLDEYGLSAEELADKVAADPSYGYDFSDLDKGKEQLGSNIGTSLETYRANLYDVNPKTSISALQSLLNATRPDTQVTAQNTLNKARDYTDLVNKSETMTNAELKDAMTELKNRGKTEDQINPPDRGDNQQDPCKGPNPPSYCFVGIRSAVEEPVVEETPQAIPYRLMAEGGIMNSMNDDVRQQLFLGGVAKGIKKAVKGATRAVKKIAKSKVGKAALLAGLSFGIPGTSIGGIFGRASFGGAAPGMFGFGGIGNALKLAKLKGTNFLLGNPAGDFGTARTGGFLNKIFGGMSGAKKAGLGIAALSALPLLGIGTGDDEEEGEAYRGEGLDIAGIRRNPYLAMQRSGNPYRLMAEGGDTEDAEPVAKKTMPLLDMGGKEKDYRETGGFVDMGRMEKADDVPARLSKNEFVFTADAVRNAGEGDIDKGAEVMYNMMKNLESGGEVSEESQGLEGAKKMFQTSQRLEGVM